MPKAPSESLVLGLVGRIYDAAANPELWRLFLEEFADAIRGGSTQILFYDIAHSQGNLTATVRLDPWFKGRYDEYYGGLDCWGTHGRHLMTSGNVVTGQMLCPDSILDASEFYHDFLRPIDAFHQFCGFIDKSETAVSLISTLRPQRAGPFGDDAVQLLRLLMPHLQRAIQLHQKIAGLQAKATSAADGLDYLPIGFLAVDSKGKVLVMNRRAEEILRLNDGLTLCAGGLAARRRDETTRLRAHIQRAMLTGSKRGLDPGGAMVVSRPSLRRPFQILVTPLPRAGSLLWPEQCAAGIFVADPEHHAAPSEEVLRQFFHLTPAEARLAGALMQGRSLDDAADDFDLSRNTVRSQLRSIFDKTATKRQGDLIRLLHSGPSQFQND